MRRFTRLTNAFSKKLQNHEYMVALYALWYNFVRIHKTLRTSPAMAGGDRQPALVAGGRGCKCSASMRSAPRRSWLIGWSADEGEGRNEAQL